MISHRKGLCLEGRKETGMKRDELIRKIRKKYTRRDINVELTNTCNLKCPLCSTGTGTNKKKKGLMDFEHFKIFMGSCHPVFDSIGFLGSGEPTLHPRLMDFVEYAVGFKKIVALFTNGTNPLDPVRIVKSGLYRITFDIEGITQAQHALYRVGADLETVLNNIKTLVREKKRQNSVFPEIYMETLISRHNENDYDRLIDMAKGLDVDGVHFSTIIDDLFKTTDWFPVNGKFRNVKRDTPAECDFKHTPVGILSYDGDIQLCCMSPHHDKPVVKDNAFAEKQILEKINSETFFRATQKAGDYAFCRECFLINHNTYTERIRFKNPIIGRIKSFRKYPYTKLMLSRVATAVNHKTGLNLPV